MRGGLIEYAVFVPALYLGLVTSIEDMRSGKIYKHHVVNALAMGLVWHLLLTLFYGFTLREAGFAAYELALAAGATLFALLISAGMWHFDVWSGADAKLFTVFVFLMPISSYRGGDALSAPLTLLVNAYTAAFLWISADFLAKAARMLLGRLGNYAESTSEQRRAVLQSVPGFLRAAFFTWSKTFFGIVLILLLMRQIRGVLRDEIELFAHLNDTMLFLILFLALRPLHLLFQMRYVTALVISALAAYFAWLLYSDPSGSLLFAKTDIGLYALGLILFRQMYVFWSESVELRRIPLEALRARMIIPDKLKRELVSLRIFSAEEAAEISVEGLSDEFAVRIREQYIDENEPGSVEIENTIAFAPFIFAGMIISVIVGGVLARMG